MVDGFLHLLPTARVYHLGLYREKSTLLPVEYYNKLPAACEIDTGYIVDPMIATAGTAIAAVNILKDWGVIYQCNAFTILTRLKYRSQKDCLCLSPRVTKGN